MTHSHLHGYDPIVASSAMTAGMGAIGRAPIHALAKDLRVLLASGAQPDFSSLGPV